MSCPTGKSKKTCTEGGSTGVAKPAFPTKAEYLEQELKAYQNSTYMTPDKVRAMVDRDYPRKVKNEVRWGRMDIRTAERLTSKEFAEECAAARARIIADQQNIPKVVSECRATGKFPKLGAFLRAVTGQNEAELREDGWERSLKIQEGYEAMLREAFQSGQIDFRGVWKAAGKPYAKTLMVEQIEGQAHTMTPEDYVAQIQIYASRSRSSLLKDHLDRVKKARKAGIPIPPEVLASYPHLEALEDVGTGRLFPDDLLFLARRALLYPSLEAYQKVIAARVRPAVEQYTRLISELRSVSLNSPAEDRIMKELEEVGKALSAHIRWAFGFDEEEIARGEINLKRGNDVYILWASGSPGYAFPIHKSVLRSRDTYALLTPEAMAERITDQIPSSVRRLLFTEKGQARTIYTRMGGKVDPQTFWQGLTEVDRETVRACLEAGKPVPPEIALRFPDLIAEYGL